MQTGAHGRSQRRVPARACKQHTESAECLLKFTPCICTCISSPSPTHRCTHTRAHTRTHARNSPPPPPSPPQATQRHCTCNGNGALAAAGHRVCAAVGRRAGHHLRRHLGQRLHLHSAAPAQQRLQRGKPDERGGDGRAHHTRPARAGACLGVRTALQWAPAMGGEGRGVVRCGGWHAVNGAALRRWGDLGSCAALAWRPDPHSAWTRRAACLRLQQAALRVACPARCCPLQARWLGPPPTPFVPLSTRLC